MKEHLRLYQEQVSKVTLNFVLGHIFKNFEDFNKEFDGHVIALARQKYFDHKSLVIPVQVVKDGSKI